MVDMTMTGSNATKDTKFSSVDMEDDKSDICIEHYGPPEGAWSRAVVGGGGKEKSFLSPSDTIPCCPFLLPRTNI